MAAFLLFLHGDVNGQSNPVLYSITAHIGSLPSRSTTYDIVLNVQVGRHQISGGYATSNHSPGTVKVNVPGINVGYRYYPGRGSSKFKGFFSSDLFVQGYQSPENQSTTVKVEWIYLFLGGGVKYFPIEGLFIEATCGLGPGNYRYNEVSPTGTIGSIPSSIYASMRLGMGYRFNK